MATTSSCWTSYNPGGIGLDVLRELGSLDKHGNVIIISARDPLDDNLTKPFHLAEFNASTKASGKVRPDPSVGDFKALFELRESAGTAGTCSQDRLQHRRAPESPGSFCGRREQASAFAQELDHLLPAI